MNGPCLCGDPYCWTCGDGQAQDADASNEAIEGFMDELLDKAGKVFDIPSIIDRSVLRDLIVEILLTDGTLSEALDSAARASAVGRPDVWYELKIYANEEVFKTGLPEYDTGSYDTFSEAHSVAAKVLEDEGAYCVAIESSDCEFRAEIFSTTADCDKAPQCDDEEWPYSTAV